MVIVGGSGRFKILFGSRTSSFTGLFWGRTSGSWKDCWKAIGYKSGVPVKDCKDSLSLFGDVVEPNDLSRMDLVSLFSFSWLFCQFLSALSCGPWKEKSLYLKSLSHLLDSYGILKCLCVSQNVCSTGRVNYVIATRGDNAFEIHLHIDSCMWTFIFHKTTNQIIRFCNLWSMQRSSSVKI
jgi:hypothetical protein